MHGSLSRDWARVRRPVDQPHEDPVAPGPSAPRRLVHRPDDKGVTTRGQKAFRVTLGQPLDPARHRGGHLTVGGQGRRPSTGWWRACSSCSSTGSPTPGSSWSRSFAERRPPFGGRGKSRQRPTDGTRDGSLRLRAEARVEGHVSERRTRSAHRAPSQEPLGRRRGAPLRVLAPSGGGRRSGHRGWPSGCGDATSCSASPSSSSRRMRERASSRRSRTARSRPRCASLSAR